MKTLLLTLGILAIYLALGSWVFLHHYTYIVEYNGGIVYRFNNYNGKVEVATSGTREWHAIFSPPNADEFLDATNPPIKP